METSDSTITGVGTYSLQTLLARILAVEATPETDEEGNPFNPQEKKALADAIEAIVDYRKDLKFYKEGEYKVHIVSPEIQDDLLLPYTVLGQQVTNPVFYNIVYRDHKSLRDKVWNVIKSVSPLVNFPKVTSWMATDIPALKEKHLLFTFALRNILARIAFRTKLKEVLDYALLSEVASNESLQWANELQKFDKDVYCLVGFNRLLSPRNEVGVSLSTDIDYKLVLDPGTIQVKTSNNNWVKLSDDEAKLTNLINFLTREQEKVQSDFVDACMLLEVMYFTTKPIQKFKNDTLHVTAERNFAASIQFNNSPITGSAELYKKFADILVDAKLDVPSSTWTQYLGETDKGSITVIKNVTDLLALTNAVACGLIKNGFLGTVEKWKELYKDKTSHQWSTKRKIVVESLETPADERSSNIHLANPNMLKEALKIVKEALKNPEKLVHANESLLHLLPIFRNTLTKEEIARLANQIVLPDALEIVKEGKPEKLFQNANDSDLLHLVPIFDHTLAQNEINDYFKWAEGGQEKELETFDPAERPYKLTLSDNVYFSYAKPSSGMLKWMIATAKEKKDIKIPVRLFRPLNFIEAVDNLKIYKGLKTFEKVERAAKLLGGFVDEDLDLSRGERTRTGIKNDGKVGKVPNNYIAGLKKRQLQYQHGFVIHCLCLIGTGFAKNLMKNTEGWRFSLKYGLCRLNDFFDSVTETEYLKNFPQETQSQGKQKFTEIKKIANVLNEFALKIQTAIYLACRMDSTNQLWHGNIDLLYSRITGIQLLNIIVLKGIDLPGYLDELANGLAALQSEEVLQPVTKEAVLQPVIKEAVLQPVINKEVLQPVIKEATAFATAVKEEREGSKKDLIQKDGSDLFWELSVLVQVCADHLKPNPRPENAAQVRSIDLNRHHRVGMDTPRMEMNAISREIQGLQQRVTELEDAILPAQPPPSGRAVVRGQNADQEEEGANRFWIVPTSRITAQRQPREANRRITPRARARAPRAAVPPPVNNSNERDDMGKFWC